MWITPCKRSAARGRKLFPINESDIEALEKRINVPKEIQEQGAEAVAYYLKALEKAGVKHLNEARIIIYSIAQGVGLPQVPEPLRNRRKCMMNIITTTR